MATSPHDTAKGVACETRSEPSPSPVSPGCRIDTKSKMNVLSRTPEHQKRYTSPCLRFCCTSNRIIISFLRVRMN